MPTIRHLCITLLLLSTPAAANWQHTRWGMTPEEVKAADPGAESIPASERKSKSAALLRAPYSASGMPFTADFIFHNNRLSTVQLVPVDPDDGPRAAAILLRVYGRPISNEPHRPISSGCYSSGSIWRDEIGRNQIGYSWFNCPQLKGAKRTSITYQPLTTSNDSGL